MLADKSLLHSRHFSKLSSLDKYFSPKKTRDKLLCIEGPSKTKVVLYTILTQAKLAKRKQSYTSSFLVLPKTKHRNKTALAHRKKDNRWISGHNCFWQSKGCWQALDKCHLYSCHFSNLLNCKLPYNSVPKLWIKMGRFRRKLGCCLFTLDKNYMTELHANVFLLIVWLKGDLFTLNFRVGVSRFIFRCLHIWPDDNCAAPCLSSPSRHLA